MSRRLILFSALIAGLIALPVYGFSQPFTGEEKKIEINHRELPQGARTHIIDNFGGSEIIKAFKLYENEELLGYLVIITKDNQEHTLYFGKDGIATKK